MTCWRSEWDSNCRYNSETIYLTLRPNFRPSSAKWPTEKNPQKAAKNWFAPQSHGPLLGATKWRDRAIPDEILRRSEMTRCAKGESRHAYSITSSVRAISEGGTVRPSALAVLRLITSSILLGRSTGSSPGLAPFKILSTKTAARR